MTNPSSTGYALDDTHGLDNGAFPISLHERDAATPLIHAYGRNGRVTTRPSNSGTTDVYYTPGFELATVAEAPARRLLLFRNQRCVLDPTPMSAYVLTSYFRTLQRHAGIPKSLLRDIKVEFVPPVTDVSKRLCSWREDGVTSPWFGHSNESITVDDIRYRKLEPATDRNPPITFHIPSMGWSVLGHPDDCIAEIFLQGQWAKIRRNYKAYAATCGPLWLTPTDRKIVDRNVIRAGVRALRKAKQRYLWSRTTARFREETIPLKGDLHAIFPDHMLKGGVETLPWNPFVDPGKFHEIFNLGC